MHMRECAADGRDWRIRWQGQPALHGAHLFRQIFASLHDKACGDAIAGLGCQGHLHCQLRKPPGAEVRRINKPLDGIAEFRQAEVIAQDVDQHGCWRVAILCAKRGHQAGATQPHRAAFIPQQPAPSAGAGKLPLSVHASNVRAGAGDDDDAGLSLMRAKECRVCIAHSLNGARACACAGDLSCFGGFRRACLHAGESKDDGARWLRRQAGGLPG